MEQPADEAEATREGAAEAEIAGDKAKDRCGAKRHSDEHVDGDGERGGMVIGNLAQGAREVMEEVRCDRKGKLGNPFLMGESGKEEAKREAVCNAHAQWLHAIVAGNSEVVMETIAKEHGVEVARSHQSMSGEEVREELELLAHRVSTGKQLRLMCWCHPKRCHTKP